MSIQDAIDSLMAGYEKPTAIICASIPCAMLQAHHQFGGRDWRRIKREVNKAAKKARAKSRDAQSPQINLAWR